MASLHSDKKRNRRIQFFNENGKRDSIRLGKVPLRIAKKIKDRIEELIVSKRTGFSLDLETAQWVAELDDSLAEKIARVGLIEPRATAKVSTLEKFIDNYIESRANLKPNTSRNYKVTRKHLVEFFGAEKRLAEITAGDADEWHEHLSKSLSPATVSRETKRAKQFFRFAVRKKLIRGNPFAELATPAQVNEARKEFVSMETIEKVIQACPDPEWRLIITLARFGGLRTPSESRALQIGDVDWENNRITIRSPKTEHHRGGASRIIPLFPELRPYLEASFDEAEPGQTHFITRLRNSPNLGTQFKRIIKQAGVKPWGKIFHNLRASRQTELTQLFGIKAACYWLGNSAAIADKHYLQVTDEEYEKALLLVTPNKSAPGVVQKEVRQPAVEDGNPSQETKKARNDRAVLPPISTTCDEMLGSEAPPRGVEPLFSG